MNDHTASNIEHLLRIHLPALSRIADALEAIAKKSDSEFQTQADKAKERAAVK
jgi:hypothetical protein